MRCHTEYLHFHTKTHCDYVRITPQVEAIVKKSGVGEGMALVSAMHITAGEAAARPSRSDGADHRRETGTWQRIFYAEFDGKRDKRVIVKVVGENL